MWSGRRRGGGIDDDLVSIPFDFLERDTWRNAVDGVRKIFLMRPPAISDIKTHINPFIDMAQEAGVQYFVLLSFLGAEKIPVVPHLHGTHQGDRTAFGRDGNRLHVPQGEFLYVESLYRAS